MEIEMIVKIFFIRKCLLAFLCSEIIAAKEFFSHIFRDFKTEVEGVEFAWSYTGIISSGHCIQITEESEPAEQGWNDNYFCSSKDIGMRWGTRGKIPNMKCTQIYEPDDPYSWDDNYLCLPESSEFAFDFRSDQVKGLKSVKWVESNEDYSWFNNIVTILHKNLTTKNVDLKYLPTDCVTQLKNVTFAWSSHGAIEAMHCVQILELAEPADNNWNDNYFCSSRDIGMRWSPIGKLPNMACTQIYEPHDTHSWTNNYLCLPKTSEFAFDFGLYGNKGINSVRWYEGSHPGSWQNNFLTIQYKYAFDDKLLLSSVQKFSVSEVENVVFAWSSNGAIGDMHCIQITEVLEPVDNGWNDNYFCSSEYVGMRWSESGKLPDMVCTQIYEPSDPHSWFDNFLCLPKSSKFVFDFGYNGNRGLKFVRWYEGSDPYAWHDNFLTIQYNRDSKAHLEDLAGDLKTDVFYVTFAWNSHGDIKDLHCVQITETAEPEDRGWNDNYFCSSKDIGMRWSSNGTIPNMSCTHVYEPADPHTWYDNYLCLPKSSKFVFSFGYYGNRGLKAVRWYEGSDSSAWNDNFLTIRVKDPLEITKEDLPHHYTTTVSNVGFAWSSYGAVSKMNCIPITEENEPWNHGWDRNFFCSTRYLGMRWSSSGIIPNMECARIYEPVDPHSWHYNYLCLPKNSEFVFKFDHDSEGSSQDRVKWKEDHDPHGWNNNYLFISLKE